MTLEQIEEVKTFLKSKGLSDDAIDGAVKSISFHEDTARIKDSEDAKRGLDIINFKPNPGKATLTQVGETQTYLGGDNRGLPIYQEDVDMIKKALPLAKRLIELQKKKHPESVEEKPLSEMTTTEKLAYYNAKDEKEKDTLRTLRDTIDEVYDVNPEELNMGPDTTENINEISEEDRMNLEAGWCKLPDQVKYSLLKSRGIKKNDGQQGDWQPGVKFPAGAVEKGLVDPGLEYYEATGRQPETPVEKYYVRQHMKRLKPEEREHYEKLFAGNENTPDIMWYFDPESQRLAIDHETTGLQCNKNKMKESFEKTQEANVCMGTRRDKEYEDELMKGIAPFDYYKYSNILKRMDDTHTRKNNDYGDAAYQGYKKYGDYYFLVQLHNKLSRLESLTVENKKLLVKDESVDDTLLDMANYAVMYLESRHRKD